PVVGGGVAEPVEAQHVHAGDVRVEREEGGPVLAMEDPEIVELPARLLEGPAPADRVLLGERVVAQPVVLRLEAPPQEEPEVGVVAEPRYRPGLAAEIAGGNPGGALVGRGRHVGAVVLARARALRHPVRPLGVAELRSSSLAVVEDVVAFSAERAY